MSRMEPANINQVNNIRLETLICFLAIFVIRIPSLAGYDDSEWSIDHISQSHPYSL
jgi:hypothetical protein